MNMSKIKVTKPVLTLGIALILLIYGIAITVMFANLKQSMEIPNDEINIQEAEESQSEFDTQDTDDKSVVTNIDDLANEAKEFRVFIEDEQQTFRDADGYKIYPVEYNGKIYLPISEIGTYLNYRVVNGDNNVYLYDVNNESDNLFSGLSVRDYDGNLLTNDYFKQFRCNIILVWSSWCPSCINGIESIRKLGTYFSDNNMNLMSLAIDYNSIGEDKVRELTEGLDISHYLYKDDITNERFIGNTENIPKILIIDNEGYLIKSIQTELNSDEILDLLNKFL